MSLDVKPGDVLFRWVNEITPLTKHGQALAGEKLHRKIARQQHYQAQTLAKEGRLLGRGEGKELLAVFTNEHIVHVAICGWQNLVWEVYKWGLKREPLPERRSFDLVVRFTRQGAAEGLADILAAIPPIVYLYPTELIGVYTPQSGQKAELIRSPARPPSRKQLEDQEDLAGELKDIGVFNTRPSEDELFFAFLAKARKHWYLDTINHHLSKAGYEKIPRFICSHFVNAVLHYQFFPSLGFVETLRNQRKYAVGPAQMARQCLYEHGVWKACSYDVLGIQHKGMFDEQVTRDVAASFQAAFG